MGLMPGLAATGWARARATDDTRQRVPMPEPARAGLREERPGKLRARQDIFESLAKGDMHEAGVVAERERVATAMGRKRALPLEARPGAPHARRDVRAGPAGCADRPLRNAVTATSADHSRGLEGVRNGQARRGRRRPTRRVPLRVEQRRLRVRPVRCYDRADFPKVPPMTRRLTSRNHRAARVAGRPSFGPGIASAVRAH